MPASNNTVHQCCMPHSSPMSRDHSNSYCYWLFIFMLKIAKKNLGKYFSIRTESWLQWSGKT